MTTTHCPKCHQESLEEKDIPLLDGTVETYFFCTTPGCCYRRKKTEPKKELSVTELESRFKFGQAKLADREGRS